MQHSTQVIPSSLAAEKYFVSRRLPSLELHSVEDEHMRNKFSNMSFRDSQSLFKRMIDPSETYSQRRHSIAHTIEPVHPPYPIDGTRARRDSRLSLLMNEEDSVVSRRSSISSVSSLSSSLDVKGRYSRSPELRTSHKMAERKRRQEMKDLFDELKAILPAEKSLKTSRWEILSQSIEYIGNLRSRTLTKEVELTQLKQEVEQLKKRHYLT